MAKRSDCFAAQQQGLQTSPTPGKLNAMVEVSPLSPEPYRRRTWLRQRLPFWLIDLGIMAKGKDCEAADGRHEWYNNGSGSACYHCRITIAGSAWLISGADVSLCPPE